MNETVFAWPGVGRLAVDAIHNNDFPVLIPVVMLAALLYLGVNMLIDITYAFIDPRIRIN